LFFFSCHDKLKLLNSEHSISVSALKIPILQIVIKGGFAYAGLAFFLVQKSEEKKGI